MMLPRKQNGFTLIEVAIVLVVMTLLLGGVIVGGTAVMENARMASLLGQIKDLAAASRDFKSRYGYYPGDLPNAATLVTTNGGVSSDCSYAVSAMPKVGNGIVDSSAEKKCALEHLVKAGMLSKVELKGSVYRIQHPFGGGEVSLWYTASNENAISVTNLPCKFALQIDGKLDSASNTPLASGNVIGLAISGCVSGVENDPVGTLLVRY
jgi:prepilin-type N-terminal cleavage/methylation domain-containing protein